MNNKNLLILGVAALVIWCVWPKRAKRAPSGAVQYDTEAATILGGMSAIYPLDKPNLEGNIGAYA